MFIVTPTSFALLSLWVLGVLYFDMSPFIHVLLVAAVFMLVYRSVQGHRARTDPER